jgi:hypothetical protein
MLDTNTHIGDQFNALTLWEMIRAVEDDWAAASGSCRSGVLQTRQTSRARDSALRYSITALLKDSPQFTAKVFCYGGRPFNYPAVPTRPEPLLRLPFTRPKETPPTAPALEPLA